MLERRIVNEVVRERVFIPRLGSSTVSSFCDVVLAGVTVIHQHDVVLLPSATDALGRLLYVKLLLSALAFFLLVVVVVALDLARLLSVRAHLAASVGLVGLDFNLSVVVALPLPAGGRQGRGRGDKR